ncbi:hypothetical protein CDIK_0340 [Cucumispora dikerogammari]|nr:hypothetical protein CDIK_0340 [Cucumispora dikerogammari]
MNPVKELCETTIINLFKQTINNNISINKPSHSTTGNTHSSEINTDINNSKIKFKNKEIIKNKQWHFLVCNKSCGLKLSTLISKSSLISQNIIEIQFIESTNRNEINSKEKFPAVYFIDLSAEVLNLFEKDLENKIYKETRVIIGNIPRLIFNDKSCGTYIEYEKRLLKKLLKLVLNPKFKILNVEFIQLSFKYEFFNLLQMGDCVYSSVIGFLDFVNVEGGGKVFVPNFVEHKFDANLHKLFKSYNYASIYKTHKCMSIDVITINRTFDLITPLMHFFTFYPLLAGIGALNKLNINPGFIHLKNPSLTSNGEFQVFKYKHLAEITTLIPKRLETLISKTNKIDETTDTSELARMILEAPILLKQKEETELLISLVEKAIKIYKKELIELSDLQNFIILCEKGSLISKGKFNIKKEKVFKKIENFLFQQTASETISESNKKIILIYLIKYYVHSDNPQELMFKDLENFQKFFSKTELKNLKKFLIQNFQVEKILFSNLFDKNYSFEGSNVLTRLEILLVQFLSKGEIHGFHGKATVSESLRKGGVLNKKSTDKRKILICLDWFCPKEIEICEVLAHKFNVNIILMGRVYNSEMAMKFILDP